MRWSAVELVGMMVGDVLSISETASFADKHIGTGTMVTPDGRSTTRTDKLDLDALPLQAIELQLSPVQIGAGSIRLLDEVPKRNPEIVAILSVSGEGGLPIPPGLSYDMEVRKLYPEAELPSFYFHDGTAPGEVWFEYRSKRPFADLAEGMILACVRHFGGGIAVERQDLPGIPGTAANFILRSLEPGKAMADDVDVLKRRLERERAARRQAESIAESKTREIYQLSEQRMKALGVLVGGVAHEVNTPIGLAYTAVTHAHDQLALIREKLRAGEVSTDDGLTRCLHQMSEGLGYATNNLETVAQLIEGFKQVAVDQTSDQRRGFDLGSYLGEIVNNLKPMLRKGGHEVRIGVPEPIFLDSFPGALSQIVTNIVINAVVHGFDGRTGGIVRIEAEMEGSSVCCLVIEDDGKGMPPAVTRRVFEPFFTTRRGEGGSGLGLHIAYNLVTQRMGGLVSCESEEGRGTRFVLRLPLSAGGGLPEVAASASSDAAVPHHDSL